MSYMDFSSWPREQEQSFVVYEQHAQESQKKALTISIVSAVAVLFIALGIYAGVTPQQNDVTKDMNMSNLTKQSTKSTPAPAADTQPSAPAAAPAAPAAGSGK